MGKIKKADIEYPFEHGQVINYILDGVSIHTVTTKIQAFFLTEFPDWKETAAGFHHQVTLKQLQSLMAMIGENCWINNIVVTRQC